MFGIKLNDEVQVNIGDMYNDFLEKVNRFLEANQDTLWAELEELEDEMLSTKITVYSKGPVVPYTEVTFIVIDEIVTDIGIFDSNLFKKLVLYDKEYTAEEACESFKDSYSPQSFCKKFGKTLTEKEAIEHCERAKNCGCNCGCNYNKDEKRQIKLDNDKIIVDISESGFENLVIGKDRYGRPVYSDVDKRYLGIGLACYS